MNWQLTLRNFGIIVLKNAVAAILTNAGLMAMLSGAFNVTTASGWWNIGKATLAVVASREASVFIPKLLKWSQTNADGSELETALQQAAQSTKKATADIETAKAVAPKPDAK
jgi:proteasome assembly chaperone (PAC2) family protein